MKSKNNVTWPVTVKTRRLELKPYSMNDYPAWVAGYKTARAPQNVFDLSPRRGRELSRQSFQKILNRVTRDAQRDVAYCLAIYQRRTGLFVGWVSFYVFDRGFWQSANIGYVLLNSFWGQGFATEAVKAAARVGFRHLKLQRLEASILPPNSRSRRLAERSGFQFECVRRRCDWERGRWRNNVIYSAIPEDFGLKSRRPTVERI